MNSYHLEIKNERDPTAKTIAICEDGSKIKLVEHQDEIVLNPVNNSIWDVVNPKVINELKKKPHASIYKNIERKMAGQDIKLPPEIDKEFTNIVNEFKRRDTREIVKQGTMLVPTLDKPDRLYISGMTGSGKSYFTREYIKLLKKAKPYMKIYIFSDVEYDKELEPLGAIRVKLDESLITNPVKTEELSNSVCVFDDIDSIMNKKIRDSIQLTLSSILKKGSSKDGIYLIVTNHAMCESLKTKDQLLNSNFVIWFSGTNVDYGLKKLGLSKEQIDLTKKVRSRFLCLHKNMPQYIVHQNGAFLI